MVVAGLSKDFYVSNSSEHWDQAIAHSGGPGQYVSIVPFDLSFARHPRDLEVFIRNVDTRHPLKRIILDEVPPEVFDRFELVFGTARVFRFEDIELDERASQIKSSISSVSCVAFETGDHRSEMIARNYANYHGLEVREIDVPSSLEKRYLEKLSLAAGSPDFDAALASLPSRSLEAFERVTVVCGHFFPYSLLYRNNAVSVLPRVFAPRVMIEEVIHADYERLHVSVLAIDGTRVQSPALVSEYAAIVPKFEQSHMRVVIFGAGTDSHVFQTLLDYYPFDLMFIAGHGIMLESRRSNYIFPAADGPHQLAMNEQHATTWYRGTIEEIDGSPVEQCNPNLVDAAMKAMEAHELQRISYRVLGKGDEALLLPNGEVHMGNCRRGSVSSLPLVFGNFCGSQAFGSNLLGGGAGGFVGTLWPVTDASANSIATEFVRQISSHPFGTSLRNARSEAHTSTDMWTYIHIGSAELRLNQPALGTDEQQATRDLFLKLFEAVSSLLRYAPLSKLLPEQTQALRVIYPRLQEAMEECVRLDVRSHAWILWLRAKLVAEAVQTGTPALEFHDEIEKLESELHGWRGDNESQWHAMDALVQLGIAKFLGAAEDQGLELIREAIEGLKEITESESRRASAWASLGNCLLSSKRLDEAAAAYTEARRLFLEAGHDDEATSLLTYLAAIEAEADLPLDADEQIETAIANARERGDLQDLAIGLQTRSLVAKHRGKHEEALKIDIEVAGLMKADRVQQALVPALYNIAAGLARLGRHEEAVTTATDAVDLARTIGHERELLAALNNRSAIRLGAGDDKGSEADMLEMQRLGWQKYPDFAVHLPFWREFRTLKSKPPEEAISSLEAMLQRDLPANLAFVAQETLFGLQVSHGVLPKGDRLVALGETFIRNAISSGKELSVLTLIEDYLHTAVENGEVETDQALDLAKARLRLQDGTKESFADANFVRAIHNSNRGSLNDALGELEKARDAYDSLGNHLMTFISSVMICRLEAWYSHNGGSVDNWRNSLAGSLATWNYWKQYLDSQPEKWDNAWRVFAAERLKDLCLLLLITLSPDETIECREAAVRVADGTIASTEVDDLPSPETVVEAIRLEIEKLDRIRTQLKAEDHHPAISDNGADV